MMNPKKRIMGHLAHPPCRHPAGESCEECDRVRRLVDGMSAGTATLVLRNAANEKFSDDVAIEGLVS